MAAGDRERWDAIWRDAAHGEGDTPLWLDDFDAWLPRRGRALDVATGAGRVALYWAARGLDALAVDVSPEGLRRAREAASRAGVALETLALDLESEPLPEGPFAAISCFHYLQRGLFPELRARLAPGGVLACEIATLANLERHAKPGAHFLLEPGELRGLCAPLELLHYEEAWHDDRALARALARRPFTT